MTRMLRVPPPRGIGARDAGLRNPGARLERKMRQPLLIGIGHEFRHDDGAGLLVARRVREFMPGKVRAVERSGEGADLLDLWRGEDLVAVVDAAGAAGSPGTVHRFEFIDGIPIDGDAWPASGGRRSLPAGLLRSSSHQFGLAEAVELGRTLHQLPRRLLIFAIEGTDFTMGQGLSWPLDRMVEAVASALVMELDL